MEFLMVIGAALIVLALVLDAQRNEREARAQREADEQAELDRLLNR